MLDRLSAALVLVSSCHSQPVLGQLGPSQVVDTVGDTSSGMTAAAEVDTLDHRVDFGTNTDFPSEGDLCARIDLLFVIDNSASMSDEQSNLIASLPGFVRRIEAMLERKTDYHIGVITTDENAFNGVGCRMLGALVTQTGGAQSSDKACGPFAEGFRFMTAADALDDSFACAAKVGVSGMGVERPLEAIMATLDNSTAPLQLCNEAFVREDALLVITIISDEEDDGDSPGSPATWYQRIAASKGDPSRIVMLSLVGHPKPNACIDEQWNGLVGAEIATRIIAFTNMFEHGYIGDVCAPSYDDFFAQALEGIAAACDVVTPVG